ncbi:MAG: hypothetical protein U9N56_00010 [Actinomycetota bacterium]|nr:hypothetical protein [Actinomycetota bacterium]
MSRAERRDEREPQVAALFGEDLVPRALDLLELTELAWHDCYGEVTPPISVIDDMLTVSGGSITGLIEAARLAVVDPRDLRVVAERRRSEG